MPRKKQPRSRGQIQSRGSDKWLVRVYLGTDAEGKRRYSSKTVNGSKKEAEQRLTEMLREVDTESYVEPSKTTIKDFVKTYLETRSDIAPSTHMGYEGRARLDIYPTIGHLRLDQLTPMIVSRLYNTTLTKERGLSARTVSMTHQLLRQAMAQAVTWGHLSKNPTDNVPLPRGEHREMKTLSSEQVQLLLERTAGTQMGVLWTVLLTTGMRPQEALGLKWSDLDGPYVIIRRALKRVSGGRYEASETKTRGSRRKVLLPPSTIDTLAAHKGRQAAVALRAGPKYDRSGDWIFATSEGGFLYPSFARRRWKADLKAAGLPTSFRLYDTRHTQATALLLRGVNPKVVSERLGHSQVGITLDVYSHVLPEMQEAAANEIEQAFFPVGEGRAAAGA